MDSSAVLTTRVMTPYLLKLRNTHGLINFFQTLGSGLFLTSILLTALRVVLTYELWWSSDRRTLTPLQSALVHTARHVSTAAISALWMASLDPRITEDSEFSTIGSTRNAPR